MTFTLTSYEKEVLSKYAYHANLKVFECLCSQLGRKDKFESTDKFEWLH